MRSSHTLSPRVAADLANPDYRGWQYTITSSVCLTLMITLLVLRLYSKSFISHTLGFDDAICVLAAFGSIAFAAVILNLLNHGLGLHQWNVVMSPIYIEEQRVIAIIYEPTSYLTKLSLLLIYHRLFYVNRTTRYLAYIGIAFTSVFYLTMMLLFILQKPGQGYPLSVVLGGVNIFCDFYVLCIPMSAVVRLQMPLKQKVGVMAVFLTGFSACVASIVSCVYRVQIGGDTSWTEIPAFIALSVEVNVGIMCSCMIYLPSLVHNMNFTSFTSLSIGSVRARLFGASSHSTSHNLSVEAKPQLRHEHYIELRHMPIEGDQVSWGSATSGHASTKLSSIV